MELRHVATDAPTFIPAAITTLADFTPQPLLRVDINLNYTDGFAFVGHDFDLRSHAWDPDIPDYV